MSEICAELHQIFHTFPHHLFPFQADRIPLNGIYILFEKGETAHGVERIVRIGTHRGDDQLLGRLKEHFINENKDRSIFRKNIGRAILNQTGDPFLDLWEYDLMTRKARDRFGVLIDMDRQKRIERQVTQMLQSRFQFVVFSVAGKENRTLLESRLIATVAQCSDCTPSYDWFGQFSPKEKIRQSGLWQLQHLDSQPFSLAEFDIFRMMLA